MQIIEFFSYGLSLIIVAGWLIYCRKKVPDPFNSRRHRLSGSDVALVALVYFATQLAASAILGGQEEPSQQRVFFFHLIHCLSQILVIAVIIYVAKKRFHNGLAGMGLTVAQLPKTIALAGAYFVAAFGLAGLTLFITMYICSLAGYENVQQHMILELLADNPTLSFKILLIVSPAILAPITEELLFRGILQNSLLKLLTRKHATTALAIEADASDASTPRPIVRWAAIVIVATIFAIFHMDWQHWPALFVLGICLGYSYERHGNILIAIIAHALFNTLPIVAILYLS